jgi:hypothetical protein
VAKIPGGTTRALWLSVSIGLNINHRFSAVRVKQKPFIFTAGNRMNKNKKPKKKKEKKP